MNHSAHLPHRSHHWLKDAQFLVGITVVLGGAAVLLNQVVAMLEGFL